MKASDIVVVVVLLLVKALGEFKLKHVLRHRCFFSGKIQLFERYSNWRFQES